MENARMRSEVIDLCRGLAILLVIYGHAIEVTFFGKKHVPVSGFFSGRLYIHSICPCFFLVRGGPQEKAADESADYIGFLGTVRDRNALGGDSFYTATFFLENFSTDFYVAEF